MPKNTYPYVKKKWIEITTYADGHTKYTPEVTIQKGKYSSDTYGVSTDDGYYYLIDLVVWGGGHRFDSFEPAEKALNAAVAIYFKNHLAKTVVSSVKKYL